MRVQQILARFALYFIDQLFDLLNDFGQIGTRKAHVGCRNPIVFDVRWYVFVMRMSALQSGFIWMWLGIIPKKLFRPLPNFIPVPINQSR